MGLRSSLRKMQAENDTKDENSCQLAADLVSCGDVLSPLLDDLLRKKDMPESYDLPSPSSAAADLITAPFKVTTQRFAST